MVVGLLFDTTRCIGCGACASACKEQNKLPGPVEDHLTAYTWTTVQPREGVNVRQLCMHEGGPSDRFASSVMNEGGPPGRAPRPLRPSSCTPMWGPGRARPSRLRPPSGIPITFKSLSDLWVI